MLESKPIPCLAFHPKLFGFCNKIAFKWNETQKKHKHKRNCEQYPWNGQFFPSIVIKEQKKKRKRARGERENYYKLSFVRCHSSHLNVFLIMHNGGSITAGHFHHNFSAFFSSKIERFFCLWFMILTASTVVKLKKVALPHMHMNITVCICAPLIWSLHG